MPRANDGDTVARTEQIKERASRKPVFTKVKEINSTVTRSVVSNFECPMCHQTLERVVAYNGVVQGWCGIAKANVRVIVSNN